MSGGDAAEIGKIPEVTLPEAQDDGGSFGTDAEICTATFQAPAKPGLREMRQILGPAGFIEWLWWRLRRKKTLNRRKKGGKEE